ncbi:MAG TPA: CocE/NonD family hydrolase C-terminal non-catalytic domain-containing protein, partial [Actinomycetota bacterium]|nr:CocE/NonD family hydrolase C-terminal non-catalytic domain-containing protein [Actinomycetota bacterium]
AHVGQGRVTFTSDPLSKDAVFLGLPELRLNASVSTAEIAHLTATLFREKVTINEQGQQVVSREPMNFCAIQPQLRNGVETITPVVPFEEMALDLQCFTMAHWVPAGQRLALEISTRTPHHASFGNTDADITVYTGPDATAYSLPSVPSFRLYPDVPLYEPAAKQRVGEAQPGMNTQLLIPAMATSIKAEPIWTLSTAAFEFDSLKGFDNAKLRAVALPTVAADLDLFLQQQTSDGNWEDLTSAASGDLDKEVLNAGRLLPGHYRIVVLNWAGGPQQVDLTLTFFNGDGKAADGSSATGDGTGTVSQAFVVVNEAFGGILQP